MQESAYQSWLTNAQKAAANAVAAKKAEKAMKDALSVFEAYMIACSHSAQDCTSGQRVLVRYVGFTYNVQIPGDPMDPKTLPTNATKDPGTTNSIFHKGAPDSYYLASGLGLAGANVGHVVDDKTGVEAHDDHWGPANPIHWGEAILSLFVNTRAEAGGGVPESCSPNSGCQ